MQKTENRIKLASSPVMRRFICCTCFPPAHHCVCTALRLQVLQPLLSKPGIAGYVFLAARNAANQVGHSATSAHRAFCTGHNIAVGVASTTLSGIKTWVLYHAMCRSRWVAPRLALPPCYKPPRELA
jgi:hypothetical protein